MLFCLATLCQGTDKTLMAHMGLPGFLPHTLPKSQEPHFSLSPCLSCAGRELVASSVTALGPLLLDLTRTLPS